MNSSNIADYVRGVEGWLFDGEARLLFDLARQASNTGVIVEIGSWKGKSTICLAKGSQEGPRVKVYAIDPHIGSEEHHAETGRVWTFDEFKANIKRAGVEDHVVPLVKMSTEAARDFNLPVSLLFIDGAHDFDSVKADFDAWFPKLINGGVVAFHDTTGWEGPRRLVRTALFRNPRVEAVGFRWSITYGRKTESASFFTGLVQRVKMVIKMLYDPVLNLLTGPAVKRVICGLLGRPSKT
jgi:hypothetical protein